jgi:hypothetical protein
MLLLSQLTLLVLLPATLYRSAYYRTVLNASDFVAPLPNSLSHDPVRGCLLLGGANASWPRLVLRVAAAPGRSYEVILRWTATRSTCWTYPAATFELADSEGASVWNSGQKAPPTDSIETRQEVVPASGVAPEGTAWLTITFVLRGDNGPACTRRFEIFRLDVTALGDLGARPWAHQAPYVQYYLGHIGSTVLVDVIDSFTGNVSTYSNDAGIPMAATGSRLTLTPNATRTLRPPLQIFATNAVGASVDGVPVFLQVEQAVPLATISPSPDTLAQLVHQFVEPGNALFPVDADLLFAGGMAPFIDTLEAAPAWVEMPVAGMIGGRCPLDQPSATMNVIIRRTDSQNATAIHTLAVDVLTPRSRTPEHTPTDTAALASALKAGGVIQLQPNVSYNMDRSMNLYGAFATTSSAADPVIVLGAQGAVVYQVCLPV